MSKVKQLFEAGLQARIDEHAATEKTKRGKLRGGNSGIITEDGMATGACARLTYLRMKGVNPDPPELERELMFAAGRSNEDTWLDSLRRTWDGPILCEEEIPTKWMTDNGTPVTGRPDIVLCSGSQDKPNPSLGIELKLVSSIWTARDVLIEDKPKMNHLIQAAHYSWQLDIPFELWYTSRVDWHPNEMVDRCLPRYGTQRYAFLAKYAVEKFARWTMSKIGNKYKKRITKNEFLQGVVGSQPGNVLAYFLKITPFIAGYTLAWDTNGYLTYTSVQTGDTVTTIITQESISKFYNTVAEMDEVKELPPRPTGLKGDGTKSYNPCDYCSLKPVCDKAKTLEEFKKGAGCEED